jgi:hypothetical protein
MQCSVMRMRGQVFRQAAASTCVSPELMELLSPDSNSAVSSTAFPNSGGGMSWIDCVILHIYMAKC